MLKHRFAMFLIITFSVAACCQTSAQVSKIQPNSNSGLTDFQVATLSRQLDGLGGQSLEIHVMQNPMAIRMAKDIEIALTKAGMPFVETLEKGGVKKGISVVVHDKDSIGALACHLGVRFRESDIPVGSFYSEAVPAQKVALYIGA